MTSISQTSGRWSCLLTPALVSIIALTVFCWVYMLTGAGTGMNVWSMSTLKFPPPATPPPLRDTSMHMHDAPLAMVGMWCSMMLAMMLPGALQHFPAAGGSDTTRVSMQLCFGLGYAAVWLLFSVAAVALQFGFVQSGLIDGMKLWSTSDRFSAFLLSLAGIWQFTGFKTKNLDRCRQHAGRSSSRLDGFRYGLSCLSSSAALMLLLFVGGVMNVYWIVLLTVVIIIEKTAADPAPFRRAIGVACLAAAAAALIL